MSARDLPHGTDTPCPFHTTTLAGFNAAHRHEEAADKERRTAHFTGACCDHRRTTRDGQPQTEETQP